MINTKRLLFLLIAITMLFTAGCQQNQLESYFQAVYGEPTDDNECLPTEKSRDAGLDAATTGEFVVVYSKDGIYTYDIDSREKTWLAHFNGCIQKHEENDHYDIPNYAIALSPDQTQIAVSGKTGTDQITIWDIQTGEHIASIQPPEEANGISQIAFSPNQKSIAVRATSIVREMPLGGCETVFGNILLLYNLEEQKELYRVEYCATRTTPKVDFTADGKLIITKHTMGGSYSLHVIDSDTGKELFQKHYREPELSYVVPSQTNGNEHLWSEMGEGYSTTVYVIHLQTNEKKLLTYARPKLYFNPNSYIIYQHEPTTQRSKFQYWENGKYKCSYVGLDNLHGLYGIQVRGDYILEPTLDENGKWEWLRIHIPTCEITKLDGIP